jgi:uncharacterized iron-regulated protein
VTLPSSHALSPSQDTASARRPGLAAALVGAGLIFLAGCMSTPPRPHAKTELWIDLMRGEEVSDEDVLADLTGAGAIYVGEAHTIQRHHAVQLRLLQELFARGRPLVLCLEQLEARDQPAVDRYNRREIDFATLAQEINWAKKWGNYADYRPLCEFARDHRIPVRGLNAPADVIRAISRGGGLAKLPAEQRAHLPAEIFTDDPVYERLMNLELAVHMAAMDPSRLRPMFEAQAARDETMAANVVAARQSPGEPARTAFVVVGAGHMRFGLGTAERARRRDPALVERLVLITESGQLQMSAADKAVSREVTVSHADHRAIGRPPGDYLRVLPRRAAALPPGHPPLSP